MTSPVVTAVAALALVAGGTGTVRSERAASPSACTDARTPLSYGWPVKPFHRQHPVRGNFGDPRTVFRGRGLFSFHNGVDIAAPAGTPVYPVVSGRVRQAGRDEIIVDSPGGTVFQYWHLMSAVRPGELVRDERTVLGFISPEAGHVHLTEIRDAVAQNPLTPGHLTPYRDSRPPVVDWIRLRTASGASADPAALSGTVEVVAAAHDEPALPVPGAWHGFPVAPAAVGWRLTTLDGRLVLPERLTVDFRGTEPPDWEFGDVYARGTRQNFATVGDRFLYGQPGHYLFDLTPTLLNTDDLPATGYVLTVTALDVCGNSGSLSLPIRIAPHEPPPLSPAAPPSGPPAAVRRLVAWPPSLRGYTVVLSSVPAEVGSRPALETARRALADGLPRVGVLRSWEFASLRPGYFVAFSGEYASLPYAVVAAAQAAKLFPGASARPVAASSRLVHWPHGRGGYTIVVRSLPRSSGLGAARAEANRDAEAGVGRVGVLVSGRFAGLRPGYYVIFSGVYRTAAAMQRDLAKVDAVVPGSYPRKIRPMRPADR